VCSYSARVPASIEVGSLTRRAQCEFDEPQPVTAEFLVEDDTTSDKIGRFIREISGSRKQYGTDHKPFEMIWVAIGTFDLAGHRWLEGLGVTEACVVPWSFYGGDFDSSLRIKQDSVKRLTAEVVSKMK